MPLVWSCQSGPCQALALPARWKVYKWFLPPEYWVCNNCSFSNSFKQKWKKYDYWLSTSWGQLYILIFCWWWKKQVTTCCTDHPPTSFMQLPQLSSLRRVLIDGKTVGQAPGLHFPIGTHSYRGWPGPPGLTWPDASERRLPWLPHLALWTASYCLSQPLEWEADSVSC